MVRAVSWARSGLGRRGAVLATALVAFALGVVSSGGAEADALATADGPEAGAFEFATPLGASLPPPLSPSSGRIYYVSATGSNTNAGTMSAPWGTIQYALNTVPTGSVIELRQGVYAEDLLWSRSASARQPVTLRAFSNEKPIIRGRLKISGSYFRASGLVFERSVNKPDSALVYCAGCRSVEVSSNEIRNGMNSGIYVGDPLSPSSQVQLIGNYIHDNGTESNQDHGIYLGHVNDALVANNVIVGNIARGIQMYPNCDRAIITQNTVVANGRAGIQIGGNETYLAEGNRVVGNIVGWNGDWGIRSFWLAATGLNNVVDSNLAFGNTNGQFTNQWGGLTLTNNLERDPMFVDRAARNFHLQASSPAIGLAVPGYSLNLDYDQRPRG